MLYPESLKSRHIRRKQSFKSVIKLVKHQFFLRSSVWWDWHLFNDSYMEWLWRPSDSFAIGFCIADLTKHNVFLAFWCSICCGYRPLNQQIDNIHSFIFCKDFAPSMKLPLVNKLQNNFKSRLECFVFVFRFLYYYYFFFFFFFIQKPLPYCSGHLMYADMSHLPTNKNGKVHRACASTVYADINHSAKRKVKTGFKPRLPTMWNIKYIALS